MIRPLERIVGLWLCCMLVFGGVATAQAPGPESAEPTTHHCVAMPHAIINVSSGVSGRIEQILVERGDRVGREQVIAELESRVERANVALARARAGIHSEIGLRDASLRFNQRRLERADTLRTRKVVSELEHESAEEEAVLARWRLNQANDNKQLAMLELQRAEQILSLRSVRSPIEGIVVERYKWPGEFVEVEPIVRVAAFDPLRVEVIVPIELHAQILPGMQAQVYFELNSDIAHRALVRVVDAMADPASGTFRVRLEVENPDNRLLAGVKCKAVFDEDLAAFKGRIAARKASGAVSIPAPDEPLAEMADPAAGLTEPDRSTVSGVPDSAAKPDPSATLEVPGPPAAPKTRAPGVDFEARPEPSESIPSLNEGAPIPPPVPDGLRSADEGDGALFCRRIGPLPSENDARRIAAALRESLASVEIRQSQLEVPNGFIVLTPRLTTRAAARSHQQRLSKSGFKHLAYIPRGVYQGRISLGVYDRKDKAERRQQAITASGFDSLVHERSRVEAAWWLELGEGLAEEEFAKLKSNFATLSTSADIEPTHCTVVLAEMH